MENGLLPWGAWDTVRADRRSVREVEGDGDEVGAVTAGSGGHRAGNRVYRRPGARGTSRRCRPPRSGRRRRIGVPPARGPQRGGGGLEPGEGGRVGGRGSTGGDHHL